MRGRGGYDAILALQEEYLAKHGHVYMTAPIERNGKKRREGKSPLAWQNLKISTSALVQSWLPSMHV